MLSLQAGHLTHAKAKLGRNDLIRRQFCIAKHSLCLANLPAMDWQQCGQHSCKVRLDKLCVYVRCKRALGLFNHCSGANPP